MAFTFNGLPLTDSVVVSLPRTGVWTIDVLTATVDANPIQIGTPATIVLGGLTFTGTVVYGAELRGSAYTRVIPGAGRVGNQVAPQSFRNVTLQQVASDLLGSVGEALNPTVTPVTLPSFYAPLGQWMVRAAPCSSALDLIANAAGCIWRFLPDGTVWFGNDVYQTVAATPDMQFMNANPEQSEELWGIASPALLPGITLTGGVVNGRVGFIEYTIGTVKQRMRVLYGDSRYAPPISPIANIVEGVMAQSPYLGSYPATVVAQQADGTYDVTPDDPAFAGTQGLTVKVPATLPWAAPTPPAITLLANAKVTLAFENGDPSKPYILGMNAGQLNITATTSTLTFTYLAPGSLTPQTFSIGLSPGTGGTAFIPPAPPTMTFNLTAVG